MPKILLSLALILSTTAWPANLKMNVLTLLSGATATGASSSYTPWSGVKTFQAKGTTSAGSGAATVKIQGSAVDSAVNADWVLLCTITLTLGTTSTGDGCTTDADWKYQRANITAISGTTATVSVYMSGGVP